MENLYFPLFLAAMAALVIWIGYKAQKPREPTAGGRYQRKRHREQRARQAQRDARARARYTNTAAAGISTSEQMWSARRRKAHHPADKHEQAPIYANYLGPYGSRNADSDQGRSLKNQETGELDHVGFDEYVANRRKKTSNQDSSDSSGFTMTAVKYESTDSEQEDKSPDRKRAGFKP